MTIINPRLLVVYLAWLFPISLVFRLSLISLIFRISWVSLIFRISLVSSV